MNSSRSSKPSLSATYEPVVYTRAGSYRTKALVAPLVIAALVCVGVGGYYYGSSTGEARGYTKGYSAGHEEAYNQGYNDGYSSGVSNASKAIERASGMKTYSDWAQSQKEVSFYNGEFVKHPLGERPCPLTVSVRGNYAYYVYLDDIGFGFRDMSFMVSPNSTAEVKVPIGEYEIYYATGETWYGPDLKFGSDTQFYKCDDTFRFYDDGEYYQGYDLELYLQNNGNLDTDKIDASEFPG